MRFVKIGLTCAGLVAAAALTGCNVENVEYHGAMGGVMTKESVPPVTTYMFNEAAGALEVPTGAVAPGEYVAIYQLGAGENESQWWCYLVEDALVAKVQKLGATPVERNDAATVLLNKENEYFPAPKRTDVAGAPVGAKENKRIPYRATRVLAYRVVAAKLWLEPDRREMRTHAAVTRAALAGDIRAAALAATGADEPAAATKTIPVTAQLIVNLRTLDANTGEVLWTGTVSGLATRDVPVSWLAPVGWWHLDDWEDWDEDKWWAYGFMWHDGDEEVYVGPMTPGAGPHGR